MKITSNHVSGASKGPYLICFWRVEILEHRWGISKHQGWKIFRTMDGGILEQWMIQAIN